MGHTQSEVALQADMLNRSNEIADSIKDYLVKREVQKDPQVRLTKVVEDYFRNLNKTTNTYSLSDTVEELEGILSAEELAVSLAKRDVLKEMCEKEGIPFHDISQKMAAEFLENTHE